MDEPRAKEPRLSRDLGWRIRTGAGPGFLAGAIFVIMLAVLAATNGQNPFFPLHMFASLILGEGALRAPSTATLIIGTIVTVILSTVYGMIYALLNKPKMLGDRTHWGSQATLGAGFGAGLWLINFQGFSRLLFPWLVTMPQFVLLVAHALFFGLPLGLMCAQVHGPEEREDAPRMLNRRA